MTPGTRVARSTHGVVHRVSIVQRDGSVMAKCGNLIVRAQTGNLLGPECPMCEATISGRGAGTAAGGQDGPSGAGTPGSARPAARVYVCAAGHRTTSVDRYDAISCPYRVGARVLCSRQARLEVAMG